MTRDHRAEITLRATPEEAFQALITPSAIRAWWQATRAIVIPEQNGVWAAAWGESEDDPEYITTAKLSVFEPPLRLKMTDYRYVARHELPFEADFENEFRIEPTAEGSRLTVIQSGFPSGAEADEFYRACEVGWEQTLAGLKRFLES